MKNANTTNRPVPNPGRTRTRPQTQGASLARREAAQATKRPAGRPAGTQAKAVSGVSALPISAHRLIASVVLAVLLLTSLIGPSGVSVPKTAALLSPNADGSNSLPGAATTSAAENELFRYLSVVERNQGDKPVVPDNVADILH